MTVKRKGRVAPYARLSVLLATTCSMSSASAQWATHPAWEKSAIPALQLGYGLTRAALNGYASNKPAPPPEAFNDRTREVLGGIQKNLRSRDATLTGIDLAAANTKFAIGTIAAGF